jgi:hypothetical protein
MAIPLPPMTCAPDAAVAAGAVLQATSAGDLTQGNATRDTLLRERHT